MRLGFISFYACQRHPPIPYSLFLAFWLLTFSPFCAKKMLPPSPDRFPPSLIEVNPRTRVQLELIFNEAIDPRRLVLDSFSADGLILRGISQGRDRSRVIIWTGVQEVKGYRIGGVVWDEAGNRRQFSTRFEGSARIDTIPPRVVSVSPVPATGNQTRNLRVTIKFSEPVDTTLPCHYLFTPKEYETLFQRSWHPNWQEIQFLYRDSVEKGKDIYFLLLPGVKDLEGNQNLTPAWTYFTSDSVFPQTRSRGKALANSGLITVTKGVVFFNQELAEDRMRTVALAPILADGSFELCIRKGEYLVLAVSDTDGDGLIDLRTDVVGFNTDKESLPLFFIPETLPKPINDYCY